MDVKRCAGCGAPAEWVLWRRRPFAEEWEAVAEGSEDEVKRRYVGVPLDGDGYMDGYIYAYSKPCEVVPGMTMPLTEREVAARDEENRRFLLSRLHIDGC